MTESHTSCTRTEEAVGWALHALEPDEEISVERHIPSCPDCQAAVFDAETVMTHLATAIEMVDPPARLRAQILGATAATQQVPAQRGTTASAAGRPVTPPPVPERPTQQAPGPRRPNTAPPTASGPSGPGRGSTFRPRRLVAAAAALAAVVVVGGLGLRTVQLQEQVDAANAQAIGLQSQVDASSAQAGNTTQLVRYLAQPGVSRAMLARPDGTAIAAVVLADGQREVYTLGLTANASDHTYVLWGLKNAKSTPQPLGAFDVAAQDAGRRLVGTSDQDAFGVYAISLEPGRTPPATPTDVVALGKLQT